MTLHTFNTDGMHFVSGLFWQPITGASHAERTREIKALAKEMAFDMCVIRTTSTNCVGFASANASLRPGTLSAAAVVSKTMEVESGARDFIFVSQLPDGYWIYVAQRDGVILPDGDQAFPSEDEAKSRLLEDRSLGDWATIVAPSIWGIRDSIERDFVMMLPQGGLGKRALHKWWRLQPVDSRRAISLNLNKILVAAILIALVGGGTYFYQKWKAEKALEEAEALAALQRANTPPPEHPWKTLPLASDLLSACMNAFSKAQLFPGNWDISGVNCTSKNLTIAWHPRPNGWIDHLRAVEPSAVISMDGSVASITIPLPDLKTGYNESVQTETQRLVAMYTAAQRYGVQFTATPGPPPPPVPGQENAPPKDWSEINWKANDVRLPQAVLEALDGDGFRMNRMSATWTHGTFIWTMEGTQYVQP